MNTNLDTLKFVVTYVDDGENKRRTFSNYDRAMEYFDEKKGELFLKSLKLFIEHTITTQVRIK